jgi:hypothetical protein
VIGEEVVEGGPKEEGEDEEEEGGQFEELSIVDAVADLRRSCQS